MKNQPHTEPNRTDKSCTSGTCGGPGLCPGIAVAIAWAAGIGINALTGLAWPGWAVGVPLALILATGAWRWLPNRKMDKTS